MNIPMNPNILKRRAFLAGSGLSLGSAALGTLLAKDNNLSNSKPLYLLPKAKAKRVIFLCMAGDRPISKPLTINPNLMN